jgi:hypothetical protein
MIRTRLDMRYNDPAFHGSEFSAGSEGEALPAFTEVDRLRADCASLKEELEEERRSARQREEVSQRSKSAIRRFRSPHDDLLAP